jgi:hypothetical protein
MNAMYRMVATLDYGIPLPALFMGGAAMPRGDKNKYTHKEKRQAEHIEEGYEERGVPWPR